jgi:hypothetical protein
MVREEKTNMNMLFQQGKRLENHGVNIDSLLTNTQVNVLFIYSVFFFVFSLLHSTYCILHTTGCVLHTTYYILYITDCKSCSIFYTLHATQGWFDAMQWKDEVNACVMLSHHHTSHDKHITKQLQQAIKEKQIALVLGK